MSSLGTLIPEAPCYVIYATRHQVYCRFDTDMAFPSTLIWYHTQKQTHNTHWDQHKYILTPPVMCSQQLSVLHWINNSLISKILQRSLVSLLCKNYWCADVTYPLIRFKTKFFLWNIKNNDRTHVNKQKTHTTNIKKDAIRNGSLLRKYVIKPSF